MGAGCSSDATGNFGEEQEMNWKNLGWGIAASVVCANAGAVDFSYKPNAAEMLRMPPYCKAKFTLPQGSPEWKSWRDRIGTNFIDLHHYCAGLNYVNRYWGARTKQERGFYLQSAMNNFNYMVKAEKPDFALRAEVYSERGEVFRLMGKPGEAVKDFNHALSINPRILKPYLQIADLQVAGKTPTRALETIAEGMRHLPDSRALQRRYLELGGKKPFPEPIVAVAEPVPAQAAESTSPVETTVDPVPVPTVSPESGPVTTTESPPPIGTPKNPYCRFCPPE